MAAGLLTDKAEHCIARWNVLEAILSETAITEERRVFVHFIKQSDEDDWRSCPPLPYRRVLLPKESQALSETFEQRWGQWHGGYADDPGRQDHCLTLHTDWWDVVLGQQQAIRSLLSAQGLIRIFEIRESGDNHELDLEATYFSYDADGEGYWFDRELNWMIYASHEASITFGGEWLIEAVSKCTPDVED